MDDRRYTIKNKQRAPFCVVLEARVGEDWHEMTTIGEHDEEIAARWHVARLETVDDVRARMRKAERAFWEGRMVVADEVRTGLLSSFGSYSEILDLLSEDRVILKERDDEDE